MGCGREGVGDHNDRVFPKTGTRTHGERQTDEGKSRTKSYPFFSLFSCRRFNKQVLVLRTREAFFQSHETERVIKFRLPPKLNTRAKLQGLHKRAHTSIAMSTYDFMKRQNAIVDLAVYLINLLS